MLAYITHPACLGHDAGPHHPERPARLEAIEAHLAACGLAAQLERHEAPLVTREALLRVHDAGYVDRVLAADPAAAGGRLQLDPDTSMAPGSLEAARRAAGAGVLAADLVMSGAAPHAFCAVRPPGHHAEHASAMGFCLFGNVAVAAAHVMEVHGLSRVAIADFDVHHGNGTEDIFRGEPRVLFCSSFRHPYYPFSGIDPANPGLVSTPLPAGTRGPEFRSAIRRDWLPALEDFQPEFLFISAGFDAHADDDMGGLSLLEEDFAWVTAELMALAGRHAQGRVVSMLEGGYELHSLARSTEAHLRAMIG